MKNLLIIIWLVLLGGVAWADSLTINTTSEWNSYYNSASDLVIEDNKLIFRHEDIPADFSLNTSHDLDGGANTSVTDDLPADGSYGTSRHITLGSDTYALQTISWANQAILQPDSITWYVKAPDHNGTSSEYYVFAYAGWIVPGGWSSSTTANSTTGYIYTNSVQYDVHPPYNHALSCWSSVHDEAQGLGQFLNLSTVSLTNNTWYKYTQTYNWTNQTYTMAVDGTNIASWTLYDWWASSTGTSSSENIGMTLYGPWTQGYNANAPSSGYSYPFTGFNTWYERYGYSIPTRMDYHVCSSFCKYSLQSGTAYFVFPLSDLSASIDNLAVGWTKTTDTDSNVTPLYSRNYVSDATLTAAEGTASNAKPGSSLTYWAASINVPLYVDLGTARTISYIEMTSSKDGSNNVLLKDFSIAGSTDNSNWTPIDSKTATAINFSGSFTNSTSYRYWRITPTSSNGSTISIGSLCLREANSVKTAAQWTGYKIETGVNTSGSSYSGITWTERDEYEAIDNATGDTTGKYLWVKVTLSTDLQAYHPEMTALNLCYNGSCDGTLSTLQSGCVTTGVVQ